jgi:hypothetical protein
MASFLGMRSSLEEGASTVHGLLLIRNSVLNLASSIAGLVAARVLSDHFENVIVVEPDPELWEKRTRVPQWCHAHSEKPRPSLL